MSGEVVFAERVPSREAELSSVVATLTERVESLEKRAARASLDTVILARDVQANHAATLLMVGVGCLLTAMILRRHRVAIETLATVLVMGARR